MLEFIFIFFHRKLKTMSKYKSSIILQPICIVACGNMHKGGGAE